MNSDKLWRTYNAFHKRYAAKYAPAIYRALQAQIKYYAETRDLVNLPTQPMTNTLRSLYKDVGRIWAANTYYNILKDAGIRKPLKPLLTFKRRGAVGLNEEFIQAIIDFFGVDLFNTVTNITETTRNFIREQVETGIQQQLSLDEIINRMLYDNITKTRAALIARTETMKGANAAEQIGSDKTGLATNKIWISVRDDRTRHDHITADNQKQPDGKPFIIGAEGFQMQRPGSAKSDDGRRIPAKEVCNCRCVVGRQVLRGKDGLPLRKVG
jgi:hypothetical protein